jgi:hypothetical protein
MRKTTAFDSGEWLFIEWWDGSSWNELERTKDELWGSLQDKTCGSAADDNANFKVRWRTNGSSNPEYASVDNVEITGAAQ